MDCEYHVLGQGDLDVFPYGRLGFVRQLYAVLRHIVISAPVLVFSIRHDVAASGRDVSGSISSC